MSDWKIGLLIWNPIILLKETGIFLFSLQLRKDIKAPDQSALQHWHWFKLVAMVESNDGQVHLHPSVQLSSVQLSRSVVSNSLQPHEPQDARTLSITNTQSLPKLVLIELMTSNHLILCPPLLLRPSIFPRITIFSNELALCIRWPKY